MVTDKGFVTYSPAHDEDGNGIRGALRCGSGKQWQSGELLSTASPATSIWNDCGRIHGHRGIPR